MTARTIVITGASDGIGASAAASFAANGDRVVIVGRSPQKTEAVATRLGTDFFVADFAKLDDVRDLAAKLLSAYPVIDVLANNAGGIMNKRELTVDGHEKTFQVNHLAPFLLTNLLIERLTASKASIINTSSAANKLFGKLDIDDLESAKKYSTNRAYGNGKLENILFTRELLFRFGDEGIATAAFHPGVVATSFGAGSNSAMKIMYGGLLNRFLLTPAQGADTLVWLGTTTPGVEWISGEYYEKRRVIKANPQAYDDALAAALWDRSAAMVL